VCGSNNETGGERGGGGTKSNRRSRIACLNTLINSLIEVTSVTFAQNAEVKQRNLVRSKSVSVNKTKPDFEEKECGPCGVKTSKATGDSSYS